jgi:hypothetical protein
MIEHTGNVRLRKGQGSGMIRLVWKVLPVEGRLVQIRERQTSILGIRQGGSVACLIMPGLKMRGLRRADAEKDS